jgi:hypothetical protein
MRTYVPFFVSAGIRDVPGAKIMAPDLWLICELTLCTATPPARSQVREVLNTKIDHQVANVYEGLKETNLAPCYHPLTRMNEALKSPAIEISNLSGKLKQLPPPGLELQATEKE